MRSISHLAAAVFCALTAAPASADVPSNDRGFCGLTMTCKARPDMMASRVMRASGLSHEQRRVVPDSCIANTTGQLFKDDVILCEQFIASGLGTGRERASAYINLSYSYLWKRKYETGRQYFGVFSAERALTLASLEDRYFADVWLALADLSINFTDPENAPYLLDRARLLDPGNWRVDDGYVRYYTRIRDYQRAEDTARKLVDNVPNNPVARQLLGSILWVNRKFSEAIDHLEAATIDYDPAKRRRPGFMMDENPFSVLAKTHYHLGDATRAADVLANFIAGRSAISVDFQIYSDQAAYLDAAGRYGEAMKAIEQAIRRAGPDNPLIGEMKSRQAGLLTKAGRQSPVLQEDILDLMKRGDINAILRVQVYLKNHGFDELAITGKFSDDLLTAMNDCQARPDCRGGLNQSL